MIRLLITVLITKYFLIALLSKSHINLGLVERYSDRHETVLSNKCKIAQTILNWPKYLKKEGYLKNTF